MFSDISRRGYPVYPRQISRGRHSDQIVTTDRHNRPTLNFLRFHLPISIEKTQFLDLSTLSVLDPAIRDILNYSPSSIEERLSSPPLDLLLPPPYQSDPVSIDYMIFYRHLIQMCYCTIFLAVNSQ